MTRSVLLAAAAALLCGWAAGPGVAQTDKTDAASPESASGGGPVTPVLPFAATEDQGVFLIVTDIHFDPFTKPELVPKLDQSPVSAWPQIFADGSGDDFQGYGSDAGYPLTASALGYIQSAGEQFDYVLYTGDYLSHDFNLDYNRYAGPNAQGVTAFGIKTTLYVSDTIRAHVGDVPILGIMGNTDSVCGDYMIAPESPLTAGIRDQWAALSKDPAAFDDFDVGGFYKIAHPTVPNLDIIALNNIFWSPKYVDACNADGGDPGAAMMAWLEWQLYATQQAGRKAQILLHVPPGINAYSTSGGLGSCHSRITPFWQETYATQFLSLIQQFAGTVEYTFSGHTHMDSFAILPDSQGNPLVASHITPAISPIFGNNPAFTAYLYDRGDGAVLDAATIYLANLPDAETGATPDWQVEYLFRETYNVPDMSASSLAKVADQIAGHSATRQTFETLYAATTQGTNPINGGNWQAFACAQTAVDSKSYATCYCSSR